MSGQQYGQSRTAMPAPLLTPQHRLGQAGSAGAMPPPSPLSTRLLWLCPNHRPLLSPLISALEGLRQSSSPQPQSSTGCELQVDEEQGPTVGPGLAVTSHFAGSRRLGLAGPEVARLLRDSGRVGMMPTASSKARHSCVCQANGPGTGWPSGPRPLCPVRLFRRAFGAAAGLSVCRILCWGSSEAPHGWGSTAQRGARTE